MMKRTGPVKAHSLISLVIFMSILTLMGCGVERDSAGAQEIESPFPLGELTPENNTGKVWVAFMVPPDSIYTTAAGNESFAPGARTYWHTHPAGEILMITENVGYHQREGEPVEMIRKGDVVKISPGVTHWHGASKDSSMAHLFIVPNTEKGVVEWGDPVTEEDYNQ